MIACTQGLVNGGTAGLFWSYIWTFIVFTFVELNLAEMASMYTLPPSFHFSAPDLDVSGPPRLVGSTTGYQNPHHSNTSNFSPAS
jgi:hypothetical protein